MTESPIRMSILFSHIMNYSQSFNRACMVDPTLFTLLIAGMQFQSTIRPITYVCRVLNVSRRYMNMASRGMLPSRRMT